MLKAKLYHITVDAKMERDLSKNSGCNSALNHMTRLLGGLPHTELQTTSLITFIPRQTNLFDSFLYLLVRFISNPSFR